MSDAFSLLQQAINQQSLWVLPAAFLGGVISSVLPCSLAMLPILVGYVGGYAQHSRQGVVLQVMLFILGIATVMTLLGLSASWVGVTFGSLIGNGWYVVIGAIAVLMGLQLLGVIHVPFPSLVKQLPVSKSGSVLMPFVLGLTFGLTASPCGTPFLAAILGFISYQKNLLLGASSLFCYALGQGVLLLVAGLSTGLLKNLSGLRRAGLVMNHLSASGFLLAGLYLLGQGSGLLGSLLDHLLNQ